MHTQRHVSVFENPRRSMLLTGPAPTREPLAFHSRLPGYRRSPLVEAPSLASLLNVGGVWVKVESSRFGLPSFKILGASWAVYRSLARKLDRPMPEWRSIEDLRAIVRPLRPLTLVAATDGNHGRAVAHMARLLSLDAHILVPSDMARARIQAIEGEGARVTVVDGNYDYAVELSSKEASDHALVISDTAWEGYEDVPRWVMDGYSTIFWEVDDQLHELGQKGPELVAAQMGVGGLATAVVQHYRRPDLHHKPRIVGVEPENAACVMASVKAGKIVSVPGPLDSIMAGLNCGVPSLVAWPAISKGIDLFVSIDDDFAREAMRALARANVTAGETGSAGLAGLLAILVGPESRTARRVLELNDKSRILIVSTEGATDPDAYAAIVGSRPM